jgi:hypothetical protein
MGLGRRADALVRAAQVLEGADSLPFRAVLIHGFSDAPGAATRLLRALLRFPQSRFFADLPADSGAGETRFIDRFLERLGLPAVGLDGELPSQGPDTRISLFTAPGPLAEVREVGHRIQTLLQTGIEPEDIGVVARNLDPYATSIRRVFGEQGIPFSGGTLPSRYHPATRRIDAVLDLLRHGPRALLDRWLETRSAHRRWADIRLAFRCLGITRLGQMRGLDLPAVLPEPGLDLPLPVRVGLGRPPEAGDDDDDGDASIEHQRKNQVLRRRVELFILERVRLDVIAFLDLHDTQPSGVPFGTHAQWLKDVARALEIDGRADPSTLDRTVRDRWHHALVELLETDHPDLPLTHEEVFGMLGRSLQRAAVPLGGNGGGVQVLDVPHARGLTFEHVFVLGLNQDAFPRIIQEDPLLSDRARRALHPVLPHLALAAWGHDEERYLFAQLLGAAPAATLSWQRSDEDDRERAPSSLILRLRATHTGLEPIVAVARSAVDPAAPHGSTAHDALLWAALHSTRDVWAQVLPLERAECRQRFPASATASRIEIPPASDLAAARVRILEARDPDRSRPEGRRRLAHLGPWSGCVGPTRATGDPREDLRAVTTLEDIARCPWRTFLRRVLRLEANPDPLAGPPQWDLLMIGNTVHGTLEGLVREQGVDWPQTLEEALVREPVLVPRPTVEQIETTLHAEARRVAQKAGYQLQGLHAVLAARARPYVVYALDVDWGPHGVVSVAGPELKGRITIQADQDPPFELEFHADRVDRSGTDLVLTDYKTGKPDPKSPQDSTKGVRAGKRLQAPAYARAAKGAVGRYLFLRRLEGAKTSDTGERRYPGDEEAAATVLPRIASLLTRVLHEGVLFPRLADSKGARGPSCQSCELRLACVEGDTGEKQHMMAVIERIRTDVPPDPQDPVAKVEDLLQQAWSVGETP